MSRATDQLKGRRPGDEADRLTRLALLAAALLFLSAGARRTLLAYFLARHFSALLPAGRVLTGSRGDVLRSQARDGLQDFFAGEVRAHAFALEVTGDLRAWRAAMSESVAAVMVGSKTLALGRALLPSEVLDILPALDFELRKLEEFAEEIRRRNFAGDAAAAARPLSARQIAARSELYSGSARAVWFRADERGQAAGVVFYYEAVDDKGTCEPCLDAEAGSPYLPGEGPFPGEVCKGRGRCRCLRIPRDAPREFARLTKRKVDLTAAGLL
jgi:hypothetical protein